MTDASGSIICIYENFRQKELSIYGSDRLGVKQVYAGESNVETGVISMVKQPGASAGKDAYVVGYMGSGSNYGNSNQLQVGYTPWINDTRHSYLDFNHLIPEGAIIHEAKLTLYKLPNWGGSQSGSVFARVRRITTSWGESTISTINLLLLMHM
ncbi:MAG: DNRLRE domain-containing protein [Cytophagaceae bacterium]